jgi:hypothetical protein
MARGAAANHAATRKGAPPAEVSTRTAWVCPHCAEFDPDVRVLDHRASDLMYACEECGGRMREPHTGEMLPPKLMRALVRWIAVRTGTSPSAIANPSFRETTTWCGNETCEMEAVDVEWHTADGLHTLLEEVPAALFVRELSEFINAPAPTKETTDG